MSQLEILNAVARGEIRADEASKLLAQHGGSARPFVMKVSEKGCVSMRGVPGTNVQFGLTLYVEAVEFILAHKAEIEKFVSANESKLSRKSKKSAA